MARGGRTAQRLDAQRELAECQRAFGAEAAIPQPRQVAVQRVVWAVDDAQILTAADFDGRLTESLATTE